MDVNVLIVGAGPTGLTLAAELARYGVSFRIVDSGRGATDLSKAVGVQARTLETLDIMGLADDLVSRGNPAKSFQIYDAGEPILKLDFTGLDTRFPYLLIVPQSDTERVLIGRLDAAGVTVERSTTLTSVTQDASGVSATVHSDEGRQETIHARWLAGCDGAHSTVRREIGIPFEGQEYVDGFMLADVRVAWDRPLDELFLFLHEGWLTAFFGFANGRYRLIADLPPDDAPPGQSPSLETCQKIVDERLPFKAALTDPSWTAYYRIHRRIVPRLQQDRVFLIGDSAHIHSPAAAQGMNTGIQDAFNLAWKLALAAQGHAGEGLLDSYHAERYPVERGVLQGTDLLLKMASLKQQALRSVRDHLLPLISSTRTFQEKAGENISEIAIAYHGSPIVLERDRGGGLRAGDRAPDAALMTQDDIAVRLHELLRRGKFLLLLFGDVEGDFDPDLLDGAANLPEPLASLTEIAFVTRHALPPDAAADKIILRDPPGLAYSKFGVTHPCARMIRPDGYIGLRADTRSLAESLREFASRTLARE
jgi:2-polyprenyl-6-methoxyphenol hydroxylase-like FAD-dependent oxidoreductase